MTGRPLAEVLAVHAAHRSIVDFLDAATRPGRRWSQADYEQLAAERLDLFPRLRVTPGGDR